MDVDVIAAQYAIGGVSALVLNGVFVKAVRLAGVPSKYLPLISIGCGMGLGMLWAYITGNPAVNGLVAGVVLGAATSGNYDAVKKVD
jgi:hypothetical protein